MPHPPSFLIIRRRYLGDVVLLGSLLRNLRLAHPDASIDVLVDPAYAPILVLNPDVSSVVFAPKRWLEWPRFLWQVRRRGYTHVFNFDNTERTALVCLASGAPFRVGSTHGDHRLKAAFAYTHRVHDSSADHEARPITEYYLLSLAAVGIPVRTREVRLVPREADRDAYRRLVGAAGRVVVVHPGSRSTYRIWPAERFASVCDRLQDEWGAQVVLVGGPHEKALIADIRSRARTHVLALAEPPDLPQLAALASLSSLFLCHDSGPMHVAAAVGTPVVALYGSQNASLFRPMGEGHTLLQPPLPCTQCVAPERCVKLDSYRNLCVQNITVERVMEAIKGRLGAGKAPLA